MVIERHIRHVCYAICIAMTLSVAACKSKGPASEGDNEASTTSAGPQFNADSAYAYCAGQCSFGPRTMNSDAHERCGKWIEGKFREYGCQVRLQQATLRAYDGTALKSTNIIASYRPELTERVLVCAHWDSRPWSDNDNNRDNWHKPVPGANDGASGIAIMIETARLIQRDTLAVGVDFVCFDAEDYGTPRFVSTVSAEDSWALGAQYWAQQAVSDDYTARFGILMDMVGGVGARFYREGYSVYYAEDIVDKVWQAAHTAGYGSLFLDRDGGMVTDDHVPVNRQTGIPTIDIIPFDPDCEQSTFGPTWHTTSDTMDNIDTNTLKAVGQTLIQVLYSEK